IGAVPGARRDSRRPLELERSIERSDHLADPGRELPLVAKLAAEVGMVRPERLLLDRTERASAARALVRDGGERRRIVPQLDEETDIMHQAEDEHLAGTGQ